MIVNSNPAKFLAGWATRRAIAAYREIQEKTMTKTTETTEWLRHEMYFRLSKIKNPDVDSPDMDCFESAMEAYLDRLREERDTLRNKLQAFEFANRSAAELLSEALREPSGLRKSVGSMVHQKNTKIASLDAFAGSPAYKFSKDECQHANIYKDIVAGPRNFRCSDCGAEGSL